MAARENDQRVFLAKYQVRQLMVYRKPQILTVIGGGAVAAMRLVRVGKTNDDPDIPDLVRRVLGTLCDQVISLDERVYVLDKRIGFHSRRHQRTYVIRTVPSVIPTTATAISAQIRGGKRTWNGQEFAVWLGRTPMNHSSGGRERLGGITKTGVDTYDVSW